MVDLAETSYLAGEPVHLMDVPEAEVGLEAFVPADASDQVGIGLGLAFVLVEVVAVPSVLEVALILVELVLA